MDIFGLSLSVPGTIVGLFFMLIGWYIGSTIKGAIKWIAVLLLFMVALFLFGAIDPEVITGISQGFSLFTNFYHAVGTTGILGDNVPVQIALFALGIALGLKFG